MKKLTALLLALICLFSMTAAFADETAGVVVDGIASGLSGAMADNGVKHDVSYTERKDTLVGYIIIDFDKGYISFFGASQTTWLKFDDSTDFFKCALAAVRTLMNEEIQPYNVNLAMMFEEELTSVTDLASFDELLVSLLEN